MARKVANPFGYGELHEALRTALDYVTAVRNALEAQEVAVKKTKIPEFVEHPIFIRKDCFADIAVGPQIVRRNCALRVEARRRVRPRPRKATPRD